MGANTLPIPSESLDAASASSSADAGPQTICSSNRCVAGHIWPARLRIAPCGSCGSHTLEIRMEMCPVCNEPAESTEVRTDWTREGMRKVAACRGDRGGRDTGNVGAVEIHHAQPSVPKNQETTQQTTPEASEEQNDENDDRCPCDMC